MNTPSRIYAYARRRTTDIWYYYEDEPETHLTKVFEVEDNKLFKESELEGPLEVTVCELVKNVSADNDETVPKCEVCMRVLLLEELGE